MVLSATVCEKKTDRAPILLTGGLLEGIQKAARIGYPAVELHMSDPSAFDADRLRETLRLAGVSVSTIGTGMAYGDDGLCFSSSDEGIRFRAVERIKSFIDAFSDLKPTIIIGLIRGKVGEGRAREAAVARVREALEECCRHAAASSMTLTLECINRYEQDYLNRVEEVAGLIDRIGAKNLSAHVDTFHMNIEETGIESTLLRFRDYLGHVHFADNNRRYPGAGRIDFKSVLHALEQAGYNGCIGLECLPWPDGETAARRGLTYLRCLQEASASKG